MTPRKKPNSGKAFERAVYEFARSLSPDAEVIPDHKPRDVHTRRKRQADVWINYKVGGHIPLKILVSCKDWRRKVGEPDIDKFSGEITAYSASAGVIYSRSGFAKPALVKAEALGVTCCRLYDRRTRAADLPPVVRGIAYLLRPLISGPVFDANDPDFPDHPWEDEFDSKVTADGVRLPLIEQLAKELQRALVLSVADRPADQFRPGPWKTIMSFDELPTVRKATITMSGRWVVYAAKMTLLHASHVMSTGHFRVTTLIPPITLAESGTPGPDWELVEVDPLPGVAPGVAFTQPVDCLAFLHSVLSGRLLSWRCEPP